MESFKNKKPISVGSKALELIMQDVLGGLEDFSLMKAYETPGDVMEILSIEPPEELPDSVKAVPPEPNGAERGRVIPFEAVRLRKAV